MFDELIDKQIQSIKREAVKDPAQYSPLVLAYIGDAVYELYVRTMLVNRANMPVHKLHKQATRYVKAKAQSDTIHKTESYLTDEELAVFKRGRNAKSGTVPKNADINDYRYATGFEALIGYLYLSNNTQRLMEILKYAVDNTDNV